MSSLRFIQERSDKRGEQEIEAQQRADDAKFVRALALAYRRGEFPVASGSVSATPKCEAA